MEKKYFIYNDKIYYGCCIEHKWEWKDKMYKFHRPKSTALQDDIWVFDLYVGDEPDMLRSKIIERAKHLDIIKKK